MRELKLHNCDPKAEQDHKNVRSHGLQLVNNKNNAARLTCPWPSDIVSKLTTFFSMENLTSPDMGSDPGDRMKMSGEQQLLSLYDISRSKGGGSM